MGQDSGSGSVFAIELVVSASSSERLRVRGQVQGVGFRPFVWRLAHEEGLSGQVWNDGQGVTIEIGGDSLVRERFRRRLVAEAPPLARIQDVRIEEFEGGPATGFVIAASSGAGEGAAVPPDTAVCATCLAELFEPGARRYRYAFLSCTDCGPRYSITQALPLDRAHTTLSSFPLCRDCSKEYADPWDRRFHAQAMACPRCGPSLTFRWSGRETEGGDAIAAALAALRSGRVVAIRGIGGYHLAVNARDPHAVARLRGRKERGGKPFALMAANEVSLSGVVAVGSREADLLTDVARPIVLLPRRDGGTLEGVAPGLDELGIMLPSAPVHYLLFHEAAGRPAGTAWLLDAQSLLLVMTSANPGGEPLVIEPEEAARQLDGVADAFLDHNRPIHAGCDDSVVRPREEGKPAFLRRGRGHVLRPIPLLTGGPPVLAVGGGLKNTLTLTRDMEAFLSPHGGDLGSAAAARLMVERADHLQDLLGIAPATIACDLHPDYASTRFAWERAEKLDLPLVSVQHHHAHIAAVLAEHGVTGPVLGIALDGMGMGPNGELWGGELLRVEGAGYEHLGGLAPLPLAGGDRAAREPWRMAAGVLHRLGATESIPERFSAFASDYLPVLLQSPRCPWTSSTGRLFDAAAALLGLRLVQGFEGQAAIELEARARQFGPAAPLADGYVRRGGGLDFLPLLGWLVEGPGIDEGAARFHATLVAGISEWAADLAHEQGLSEVVLGGGCWANRLLEHGVRKALEETGYTVRVAEVTPPGDGGLSLGQAWVTLQQQRR